MIASRRWSRTSAPGVFRQALERAQTAVPRARRRNDLVQENLPEHDHGDGADLVHDEIDDIAKETLHSLLLDRHNILFEAVGKTAKAALDMGGL